MKCSDALPLLDLLNDGALDTKDSALVLDHISKCESCHAEQASNEYLRAKFVEAKSDTAVPADLMNRISGKLKDEERLVRLSPSSNKMRGLLALAACIALCAIPLTQSSFKSVSVAENHPSADSLIENATTTDHIELASNAEISQKVGYTIKKVNLPDWQLQRSGVFANDASTKIARFEFAPRANFQGKLTCYQAQQGTISANNGTLITIGDKQVRVGQHGNYSYGVWTQNERDYLFVSDLSLKELENVISKA
ncbi:MAG TPA: hypothetical protein V6C76_07105 [Drouetiella sp.]